jgi:hypothetical protein
MPPKTKRNARLIRPRFFRCRLLPPGFLGPAFARADFPRWDAGFGLVGAFFFLSPANSGLLLVVPPWDRRYGIVPPGARPEPTVAACFSCRRGVNRAEMGRERHNPESGNINECPLGKYIFMIKEYASMYLGFISLREIYEILA